jgi:two-component system, OmpR family, phosphate regulon sensor histidine kinase PhoR
VKFLWFLAGLVIGSVPLLLYRMRLSQRLRDLTHHLDPSDRRIGLSLTSQLTMAIAHQQEVNYQLEQDLEVWRQILNTAPIGYLQVDAENQLLRCNPFARELLGIAQGSYYPPRLLLELVRSYELDSLIDRVRDTQKPCQKEWTFNPTSVDADDLSALRSMPIRGFAFPLRQDEVGVFLENRQETLTLAQQRDRWASDVAHELKTPLTSIRLVAETLQGRLEAPHRAWVDRLLAETIRLSELVQDLLDLSQLELNPSQRLRLQPVDLVKLIYAAWQSLEPLATEKHLKLRYDGPESAVVQADEPRFHRVFLNLFDNAIKYSPERQVIQVQVAIQDDPSQKHPYIHIDVMDAGSGFPEKSLPHVFERFYRADPSRVRMHLSRDPVLTSSPVKVSSGSGLGLSIVQQIVEAHHGTVSAKNHPEIGGGWLQILLPCHRSYDA